MEKTKLCRVLKWIAGICGGVVLLILAGLAMLVFAPHSWINKIAGDKGSAQIGREFAIDGDIHIDWDWTTPFVHLGNIRLSNMPGAKDPNMIAIEEVNFHIKMWHLLEGQLNLPDITLVKPVILLETSADGKNNWDFPSVSQANVATKAALPTSRSNFPLLGFLSIEKGTLHYIDATKALDLTLAIDSAKGSGTEGNGNFRLTGDGTLQNQNFTINAEGGSLAMLRDSNARYPLNLSIQMGQTSLALKGTFADPVKMENIDAVLDIKGHDLADIYYLTTIPLPPSPPYVLSGHLTRNGAIWKFDDFKGQVGHSDLSGELTFDTSGNRALATGEFKSHVMRMSDLSGFIGEKPNETPAEAAKEKNGRVLPNVPLNLDRLRSTDMTIHYKADQIDQPGWPLDNLDIGFNLKDGILRLDPFSFGVAEGKIDGPIVLDGSKDEPVMTTDLSLHRLSLKPFFSDSRFAAFSDGHFGGRFKISGHGRSVADVLGDSDGRITMMMSGGSLSKLVVAAAGLDFGKATVLLLGKDETTGIRCAIGDFDVQNGLMRSDAFVLDTTASNVDGTANINLKDETLDTSIEAHPKHTTLAAGTPITVTGSFRSPSIGIDPKELAGRGAAAAALSVVATPLAGVIPFIELGLGKDSDCNALMNEAQSHAGAQAPTNPQPPTAH